MRPGSVQTPAVVRVAPEEYAQAGGVLGRAFRDDHQWTALMPDPEARRTKLPAMFTGATKLTVAAGGVPERTADFEAVALWLAPGRDIGLRSIVRSGFSSVSWALTPPFVDFRRMMAVLRQFDQRHREVMPEPHWYVMAIGVDPERQGRGHGAALMQQGMQRADLEGRPIYLEADSDNVAGYYERLGFEVIDEMTIRGIDLRFSLMLRRPGTAR